MLQAQPTSKPEHNAFSSRGYSVHSDSRAEHICAYLYETASGGVHSWQGRDAVTSVTVV